MQRKRAVITFDDFLNIYSNMSAFGSLPNTLTQALLRYAKECTDSLIGRRFETWVYRTERGCKLFSIVPLYSMSIRHCEINAQTFHSIVFNAIGHLTVASRLILGNSIEEICFGDG